MKLRKGKTKSILDKSLACALLAVEIYNKPKVDFRVESYITHMIMAWTKLFHAHFHHTIGEKYYYKNKSGRYKRNDGEKKAWDLNTCINKYCNLSEATKTNLIFFIKLRNKIEHRHINNDEIGIKIFGECQSLLYNYEDTIITLFGEEYALYESLVFALQFSKIRTEGQQKSNKKILSKELKELKTFIDNYRERVSEEVFNSQEFSIKLILMPKISNTNRSDIAIEFVKWNSLSEEDKDNYYRVTTIIKDKIEVKEVVNPGRLKPGEVLKQINENCTIELNHYDHKCLYYIFSIRPTKEDGEQDLFDTNTKYCHYDEVHEDYVYQDRWVVFLIHNINSGKFTKECWAEKFKNRVKRDINKFEIN